MNWRAYVQPATWLVAWGMATAATAAPAPWYWWSSRYDGQRVCAQVMPSQGWRRAEGPFQNAQCQSQRRSLIMPLR